MTSKERKQFLIAKKRAEIKAKAVKAQWLEEEEDENDKSNRK